MSWWEIIAWLLAFAGILATLAAVAAYLFNLVRWAAGRLAWSLRLRVNAWHNLRRLTAEIATVAGGSAR